MHPAFASREEEFLSDNRDIALKILDQQCKTYFKDPVKETIVKAFDKLFRNGQLVPYDSLSDAEKQIIEAKPVSHYIVWRCVFKPSLSTPCRPVFDASTNTKPRPDGSAGRCLNDLVVKGRVTTLNLVKMVMRFCAGLVACQGDLAQFYASIHLDPQHWNLQRVLYRMEMDPDNPVVEAIIRSLIWGIKCIAGMSECSVHKLADAIRKEFPRVAALLKDSRFVDDCGDSAKNKEIIKTLTKNADEVFDRVSLKCKGWTYSGEPPPPEVCEEGNYVSIGGMKWYSEADLLEIPIPAFHLSKKVRGRIVVGTEVFEGHTTEDLEKFVKKANDGKNFTRRQIFSKYGQSFYDILGKLVPIENVLKIDLREANESTKDWDDRLPDKIHNKWIQNFLRLEKLKGIKFYRAIMPSDAVSTEMNAIGAGDTSGKLKNTGVWGRFLLKNGNFSCQLIMGRSLLANNTIPKDELDALCMTSNLMWIVRLALDEWITSYIVINDSTISLSWTKSDKKRLSIFHRNRVVQIRRGTELSQLYHVVSEGNPSDCGTRPELVSDEDIGPGSVWENGLPWMKKPIEDAVASGILTPLEKIKVSSEEEKTYNEGFVFERSKEILTPGHPVVMTASTRVQKVAARAEFSSYIISPTKFSFDKCVRIVGIVFKFIRSFKCRKKKHMVQEVRFQMFTVMDVKQSRPGMTSQELEYLASGLSNGLRPTDLEEKDFVVDVHRICNMSFGCKDPSMKFTGKKHVLISSDDISRALGYLFSKASAEVKHFNKSEFLKKIAIERNGILFSRSRLLDGQRFQEAGGLEDLNILQQSHKDKSRIRT